MSALFMPGVNPVTFPKDSTQAAYNVENSDSRTLHAEPPLACYVTLRCRRVPAPYR